MKIIVEARNDKACNPAMVAWSNSRPNNSPISESQISKLDLPVNEIPVVTLFVECTMLEREIIVSARNHVVWAQTSRVQNCLDFDYPDTIPVELFDEFEDIRAEMNFMKDNGVRQDEYRKLLPVLSNCALTMNISTRDLVSLNKTLNNLAEECPHLSEMFLQSANETLFVLESLGIHEKNISNFKGKKFVNEILDPNANGAIGDSIVITENISMGLRSHLVRHRGLHISDNLLDLVRSERILTATMETGVVVQASGLRSEWIEVTRKRSCWIAQYDLWKNILNKADQYLNIGSEVLPCYNGSCPYNGDAMARYTNEDPNAVCPKHALINSKTVSGDQMKEMINQHNEDKRPDFWKEDIVKLAENSGLLEGNKNEK